MGRRFRVHDLRRGAKDSDCGDLGDYLKKIVWRLHNAEHALTRVFTCRSWRSTGGKTASYEHYWNEKEVPGETLLGSCGMGVEKEVLDRIEAEFAKGESVRLFTFNSDADLIIEEVLEPLA
jgi:hypothetical protein